LKTIPVRITGAIALCKSLVQTTNLCRQTLASNRAPVLTPLAENRWYNLKMAVSRQPSAIGKEVFVVVTETSLLMAVSRQPKATKKCF
jgi:hypothetical protein